MLWFLNERTIERSFHQPCTHCSRTNVMKCVHSVVISKTNACVLERKVVCTAVVNRLEKVSTFMQWLEKSSGFTQVQGLGSLKSTLTRLYATHHSFSLPESRQINPRALGVILSNSKSRTSRLGGCNSGDGTRPGCPGSKDDTHPVHLLMFVFPRRLDQLSRCHRWVDLALLFKKGVGREIAVLEVADNVFSNVQHSRNPVLKFCGRRTAGDLSQNTRLRPELFSWRLRLCSLEENATVTATTSWCSMAKATVAVVSRHEVSPRLARQCG